MGVDIYVLDFLVKHQLRYPQKFGKTLWLGRQGFHIERSQAGDANAILAESRLGINFEDIHDGLYADRLFRALGSNVIHAMDISDFEGADIIHDLNIRIDAELYAQFDSIFDGGTLEHIFNIPVALENIVNMLRDGGLFISVNGANNQLGHGFYQFSPELFWSFFRLRPNFIVESLMLMPCTGKPHAVDAPDPAVAGNRQEIGATAHPTYLFLAARKSGASGGGAVMPQQSDYAASWARHSENKVKDQS